LATFELANKFYLVFPWADDDLETFWENRQPDTDLSTWLLGQFLGLSEALCLIHRYRTTSDTNMPYQGSPHCTPPSADRATFEAVNLHRRYGDTTAHRRPPPADHTPSEPLNFHGRHGDIKPNNILYFAQGGKEIQQGILKITDFGIARFTPENVALKRENGIVPNSPTYRSPECDFKNMEISSQCDMWALGCVYLVFLTWFFGGYGDVMEFAKSRQSPDLFWHNAFSDTFFTVDPDPKKFPRASVKASVIKVSTLLQVHGTHSLNACRRSTICDLEQTVQNHSV
jgi:serine/threonine protein kinase